MDEDLQALRRAAAREPDAPGPLLALVTALARAGARDEALEALYLAAVLGADPAAIRATSAALGARPSPWPEFDADARGSRRSPLRGPRRGEVVVRAPGSDWAVFCVLDADGAVLIGQRGGIAVLDGRTLGERERLEGLHSPAVAASGTFALAQRPKSHHVLVPLRGEAPAWNEAGVHGYVRPTVDGAGRFHVSGWILGPDLTPVREHAGRPARARAWNVHLSTVSIAPDLRLALLWTHYDEHVVELFDPGGASVGAWHVAAGARPVFDDDGLLLVFTTEGPPALQALGPDGRPVWTSPVTGGRFHARLAAAGPGACYVSWTQPLSRVERGRTAWTTTDRLASDLVVDREGVVYAGSIGPDAAWRLTAWGPDGGVLFQVPGRAKPMAIDGLGRLLAILDGDLVAIA